MRQAIDDLAGQFSTRDLAAFNRWLCVSRLRAVSAIVAFLGIVVAIDPHLVDVPPVLGVCAWLAVISAIGLASDPARLASRTFLCEQTLADLLAVTIGIHYGASGQLAPLMRWLYALVVVPVSLISVPVGLFVASGAAIAHGILLGLEHGWTRATFLDVGFLAPTFLFFLIAQQCFFYAGHLERKNRALAALADEVRTADALKGEFVGAVSHELRSPLNVILGYLEMAIDGELGPLTDAQTHALRRTQLQSLGLLEMITALLDLNRFEAGRVPLERSRVSLGDLLRELREQTPDLWRRPGVALRCEIPDDLPPIETDRGKVKTVVRNLLHNALKFTDAGEVVLSVASAPDGGQVISVRDTGRGMPPEAVGYVFDMFRQVPGSGGGGVGLGLHIVQRLVGALGGRVEVDSELGRGSRFTVVLPPTAPAAAPSPPSPA